MTSSPFKSWRRFLVAMAGVCAVFVVLGLIPQGRTFVEDSDRKFFDNIIRSGGGPEEREDFVLLGIDEASMSLDANLTDEEVANNEILALMRSRFPWDRKVWAATIDKLCEAGATLHQ